MEKLAKGNGYKGRMGRYVFTRSLVRFGREFVLDECFEFLSTLYPFVCNAIFFLFICVLCGEKGLLDFIARRRWLVRRKLIGSLPLTVHLRPSVNCISIGSVGRGARWRVAEVLFNFKLTSIVFAWWMTLVVSIYNFVSTLVYSAGFDYIII